MEDMIWECAYNTTDVTVIGGLFTIRANDITEAQLEIEALAGRLHGNYEIIQIKRVV